MARLTPQRAAVLAVLRKAGTRAMRPRDIAAATGMKRANVCMTLLRMRGDGLVLQPAYGLWSAENADDASL